MEAMIDEGSGFKVFSLSFKIRIRWITRLLKLEPGSLLSSGRFNLVVKVRSSTVNKILTFARNCSFSLALDTFIRPLICCFFGTGTQRRVQKKHQGAQTNAVSEDKRLKAAIKKFGKSYILLVFAEHD